MHKLFLFCFVFELLFCCFESLLLISQSVYLLIQMHLLFNFDLRAYIAKNSGIQTINELHFVQDNREVFYAYRKYDTQ